jgi:hypothetical protein
VRLAPVIPLLMLPLLCAVPPAGASLQAWVDAEGRTHLGGTPARGDAPAQAGPASDPAAPSADPGPGIDTLRSLWRDGVRGAPLDTPAGASSREEDRVLRLLRDAAQDLERGETTRAATILRDVLRLSPGRPEAHWYLALLEGQRGHLDASEDHLRRFLTVAGDDLEPWRAEARLRLARLGDERRLQAGPPGELRLARIEAPGFRLEVDETLQRTSPGFAPAVLRFLAEARSSVGGRLGVEAPGPTGVVLYTKAAYRSAHRQRFSFPTVGFFDGRIHVASSVHPEQELQRVLFHEYTHALFRESVGSDRPFWLNEGLAELSERALSGTAPLSRSERAFLRRAIAAGEWIPLRRLAPSFGGLTPDEARLAYLQGTAAAAWIEERTDRAARGRLLGLLREGRGDDAALGAVIGLDTDGVDGALRSAILAEFPAVAQ